jgi:hypothetical protein
MKAITLYQPWASAIACGLKTHETRSWSTKHRGFLAIHASKSVPKKVRDDPSYDALYQEVMDASYGDEPMLPTSCIVTVCWLSDCVPTEAVTCKTSPYPFEIAKNEISFGDYSPGRFAWRLLRSIKDRMFTPIHCAGHRGLWDIPPELIIGVAREMTKEA